MNTGSKRGSASFGFCSFVIEKLWCVNFRH